MNTIFFVPLRPNTTWTVTRDDPQFLQLNSVRGVYVLNPLLHADVMRSRRYQGFPESRVVGLYEDDAIVQSSYLVLIADRGTLKDLVRKDSDDWLSTFLDEVFPEFSKSHIRALRYVTKQAQLPTGLFGKAPHTVSGDPDNPIQITFLPSELADKHEIDTSTSKDSKE